MRLFALSMIAGVMACGAAWSQGTSSDDGNMHQIPFGQTYKNFQFPLYQNGVKTAMLSAVEATGKSLNYAEATDLKIELYEKGEVSTTITSPDANLYVADRKMRTKHTVRIVRSDMEATSQSCDFDLSTKDYVMRENVKVILKNFDTSNAMKSPADHTGRTSAPMPSTAPSPRITPVPSEKSDSLLETPGAYASTNVGPIAPGAPANP